MTIKLSFIFISLSVIMACNSQNTDNDNEILNQLKKVETGEILKDHNAWLITPQNDTVPFSKFKGKWLIIDFWSYGCKPCIEEFQKLESIENKFENVEIIAVSVDNSYQKFLKGLKKYKIPVDAYFAGYTYENAIFNLNVKTDINSKNKRVFQTITPQYVLVNPKGVIVEKALGKPSLLSDDFTDTYQYKK